MYTRTLVTIRLWTKTEIKIEIFYKKSDELTVDRTVFVRKAYLRSKHLNLFHHQFNQKFLSI